MIGLGIIILFFAIIGVVIIRNWMLARRFDAAISEFAAFEAKLAEYLEAEEVSQEMATEVYGIIRRIEAMEPFGPAHLRISMLSLKMQAIAVDIMISRSSWVSGLTAPVETLNIGEGR